MKLNGNKSSPGAAGARHRRLWIILAVVVLALAAAVTAYFIWERPPEIAPAPQTTAQPGAQQSASSASSSGTTAPAASGSADSTQTEPAPGEADDPEPIDDRDAPSIAESSTRRKGVYTFLILGRDRTSNSTDTILACTFDTVQHSIYTVSIPRDTLINISWGSTPKKINTVFPGYENSGRSGVEGVKEHLRKLLGFSVDCYAVVSLEAVEQAVDCIGGVWFDVPQDMRYYDPTQNLIIEIDAGYQLLNGEDALKVLRFRDGYAGGDLDRIAVQQSLLRALASQILTLGNIPNLGELVNILQENLDTDLTAANMAWLARQFLACSMENVSFDTLPISAGCYINGISYVSTDVDAWLAIVNERLNPYVDDVTTANVDILSSNYSGTRMSSTTGAIAGGADSFYCLNCTLANGGKAAHHLPGTCPNGG